MTTMTQEQRENLERWVVTISDYTDAMRCRPDLKKLCQALAERYALYILETVEDILK